jgi:hypothetical protein
MIEILNWFAASWWRGLSLFVFVWLVSVCLEALIRAARK